MCEIEDQMTTHVNTNTHKGHLLLHKCCIFLTKCFYCVSEIWWGWWRKLPQQQMGWPKCPQKIFQQSTWHWLETKVASIPHVSMSLLKDKLKLYYNWTTLLLSCSFWSCLLDHFSLYVFCVHKLSSPKISLNSTNFVHWVWDYELLISSTICTRKVEIRTSES